MKVHIEIIKSFSERFNGVLKQKIYFENGIFAIFEGAEGVGNILYQEIIGIQVIYR